jgi:hypothetical protein
MRLKFPCLSLGTIEWLLKCRPFAFRLARGAWMCAWRLSSEIHEKRSMHLVAPVGGIHNIFRALLVAPLCLANASHRDENEVVLFLVRIIRKHDAYRKVMPFRRLQPAFSCYTSLIIGRNDVPKQRKPM